MKTEKNHQLNLRVSTADLANLKTINDKFGTSTSESIRRLIYLAASGRVR